MLEIHLHQPNDLLRYDELKFSLLKNQFSLLNTYIFLGKPQEREFF